MPPLLPWIKPTAAALIALTVGVSVVYYSSDLDALNNDCRREPPYQVFRRVVGMPVPRGITDLQVAGRHNFTKSWVWMRFDIGAADEKSLATWFGWQVMADPFSPNVPPTSEEIETDYSGHSLFDTQDKQSVGLGRDLAHSASGGLQLYIGS